jgi:hypothetical protein
MNTLFVESLGKSFSSEHVTQMYDLCEQANEASTVLSCPTHHDFFSDVHVIAVYFAASSSIVFGLVTAAVH